MSYGLHHPRALPPRSRRRWRLDGRTPTDLARWSIAQVGSHLVSGLAAFAAMIFAYTVPFKVAAARGFSDHGPLFGILTAAITIAAVDVLVETYRAVRHRTRPAPLAPPVELPSGRSSPLYDHELDGVISIGI